MGYGRWGVITTSYPKSEAQVSLRLAITNTPLSAVVLDKSLLLEVVAQIHVLVPLVARHNRPVRLVIFLHVRTNMLHAFFPAALAVEGLVAAAEEAGRLDRVCSESEVAPLLMLYHCLIGDLGLAVVVQNGAGSERMAPVHAAQVLREEVLAVEVVVDWVLWVPWQAHVAAPETELDVLSADVPFPFILRRKSRAAAVLSQRTWERSD